MIQRRAVVGIGLAASVAMLAGCGFESPDVEATEHASIQAIDFSVGQVQVRDAFITSVPGGLGGGPNVSLVVTFVNDNLNTADTLTGITTPLGTATVHSGARGVVGSALPLPPKGVPVIVQAAPPATLSTGPTITIAATTAPVLGTYVPVTFTFGDGQSSPREQVPVVPANETTAATSPVPTATASVPSEAGVSASD